MLVNRINKYKAIEELKEYVKQLKSGNIEERTFRRMNYIVNIINHDVEDQLTYIECGIEEITSILKEYLNLLSKKHHLLICCFVGTNTSIDAVPFVRSICGVSSEEFELLPSFSNDNRIRMYIYYYSNTNKKASIFDIDYSVKIFFD